MIRSVVLGCGSYLPTRVLTNTELAQTVDTSDEWIVQRTGIHERRIAADGEKTSDLSLNAAKAALANADGLLRSGAFKRALVIGGETFSRILDWKDRTTCVLFGDGAGAVVLEAQELTGTNDDRGILTSYLRSDGRYRDKLYVDGGPSSTQTVGHLRMDGREVFRHAVGSISEAIEGALGRTGLSSDDIDWFVPHQANKRIIDGVARKLKLKPEQVVLTLDRHGNTSAASIPLALSDAVADRRIKRGDLVMLEAMGGGFTWGASLIRW
jgi:3-oxoacyl-[acyl-carrier-protein] synthase-3